MRVSREDLARSFAPMSDDELLERFAADGLTELAREVMAAELRERDLVPPARPQPPAETATEAEDEADDDAAGPVRLETVRRYINPTEAKIHQGLLLSEDIPAFLADAQLVQVHSLLIPALGGLRLQVRVEHLETARGILAQADAGERALDDADTAAQEALPQAAPTRTPADEAWARVVILALTFGLGLFLILG